MDKTFPRLRTSFGARLPLKFFYSLPHPPSSICPNPRAHTTFTLRIIKVQECWLSLGSCCPSLWNKFVICCSLWKLRTWHLLGNLKHNLHTFHPHTWLVSLLVMDVMNLHTRNHSSPHLDKFICRILECPEIPTFHSKSSFASSQQFFYTRNVTLKKTKEFVYMYKYV